MNNAGMTGALLLVGTGLFANAFMGNTQTVQALPDPAAVAVQGDVEPTIVWYGAESQQLGLGNSNGILESIGIYRAWSTGRIERLAFGVNVGNQNENNDNCNDGIRYITSEDSNCWHVVDDPQAAAASLVDLDHDEVVDGRDLATFLAAWDNGARRAIEPSTCAVNLKSNPTYFSGSEQIVWLESISLGRVYPRQKYADVLIRAWSDGRVEARIVVTAGSCSTPCTGQPGDEWNIISTAEAGYLSVADFDFDEEVSGSDLAILLARWGGAPPDGRLDVHCPLPLINP